MARSVGIVAEYNPFHNGHKYLLDRAREIAGEDGTVISVMSGDFVQRGEAALFNKHARAEAACRSGIDMVIELPLPWSLMSAEGFASAAVDILSSAGADTLAFGAESDNISELKELASVLLDSGTDKAVSDILSMCPEKSYPAARREAAEKICGKGYILDYPNNILAVEYIKASYRGSYWLDFAAFARKGAAHDSETGSEDIRSASSIRNSILNGRLDECFIPQSSIDMIKRETAAGRGPVSNGILEQALLSRLRMLNKESFDRLPDSQGGVGNRLYAAARDNGDIASILSAATATRYPTSRMRRMLMFAALEIDSDFTRLSPPYIRILAANEKGREYLKKYSACFNKPLIIKPASINSMDEECRRVFEKGSCARDLYVLAYSPESDRRPGSDFRSSPLMI